MTRRAPTALALARQFNPAMALPEADGLTPTAVSYAWSGGADLMGRAVAADGRNVRNDVVRKSAELDRTRWDDLPARDRNGNKMEYWVDAPGDDKTEGGVSGWQRHWRAQQAAHTAAATPTQYAHLFWLDSGAGLLVIQYWFYYPYNEWVNHHEGDWEHVNVILQQQGQRCGDGGKRCRVDDGGDFKPVDYEFYFHRYRIDEAHPVRDPGDGGTHATVFVGGRAQFWWWSGGRAAAATRSGPVPRRRLRRRSLRRGG